MSVRPEHTRGDTDANALAFALDFIGLDIGTKRSVEIANYARAALDRLVARNQQLQEALAEAESRLKMAIHVLPSSVELSDTVYWLEQVRAALASVRARSET